MHPKSQASGRFKPVGAWRVIYLFCEHIAGEISIWKCKSRVCSPDKSDLWSHMFQGSNRSLVSLVIWLNICSFTCTYIRNTTFVRYRYRNSFGILIFRVCPVTSDDQLFRFLRRFCHLERINFAITRNAQNRSMGYLGLRVDQIESIRHKSIYLQRTNKKQTSYDRYLIFVNLYYG